MEKDGEAAAAISALNGKVIEGRLLKVNEAWQREPSRTNTGGRYGRGARAGRSKSTPLIGKRSHRQKTKPESKSPMGENDI